MSGLNIDRMRKRARDVRAEDEPQATERPVQYREVKDLAGNVIRRLPVSRG